MHGNNYVFIGSGEHVIRDLFGFVGFVLALPLSLLFPDFFKSE